MNPAISRELSRVGLADIFNLAIQQGGAKEEERVIQLPSDSLLFDDIDRLLRGEEPLVMQDTRPVRAGSSSPESRIQSALGMGTLTRREVGSDRRVLVEEAQRVKEQIERELRSLRSAGNPNPQREKELGQRLRKIDRALQTGGSMVGADWRKKDAKDFDGSFNPDKKFGGSYDWSQSYAKRAQSLGSGTFGSVIASPSKDNPVPTVVKRGSISEKEIDILSKISGKDLGPDLVAAEINTKRSKSFGPARLFDGRIAMTEVTGKAASEFSSHKDKVGDTTVGDSYWALRKRLHSQGIAHNDSHIENVIIDRTGKARFIDFGLSQDNPKAALSEAAGIFSQRMYLPMGSVSTKPLAEGGDKIARKYEQFSPWAEGSYSMVPGSNLDKIVRNRTALFKELKTMGLSNDEIVQIVTHGTQQPLTSYEKGPWGKLTNADAIRLTGILYKGVE